MVIDLTQVVDNGMPIFPGTEEPKFETALTWEANGFKQTRLQMLSHVGTHLDCPAHVNPQGLTTDTMDINQYIGDGVVLDCSELGAGGKIDLGFLVKSQAAIQDKDFILFYTGWDKRWGTPDYFEPFPSFTAEAIGLLGEMNIKGIGIDVISIDPIDAQVLNNHNIYFQHDRVAVENLKNLDQLLGKEFTFCCFPLKLNNGDGSPIRAAAILK